MYNKTFYLSSKKYWKETYTVDFASLAICNGTS
jgi:hypothetical protein